MRVKCDIIEKCLAPFIPNTSHYTIIISWLWLSDNDFQVEIIHSDKALKHTLYPTVPKSAGCLHFHDYESVYRVHEKNSRPANIKKAIYHI